MMAFSPKMTDEALKEARSVCALRPGTADSDVNAFALPLSVPAWVLWALIEEIERLRNPHVAKELLSFREIKQEIKSGSSL